MIIGIGIDMVAIKRIERAIDRFGMRFLRRIFTPQEIAQASMRMKQGRFYALRFAAKEAAWKALSPNRGRGIGWHDFEVVSRADGKPELRLHNTALSLLKAEGGKNTKANLSLSDDDGFALAFVVFSAA